MLHAQEGREYFDDPRREKRTARNYRDLGLRDAARYFSRGGADPPVIRQERQTLQLCRKTLPAVDVAGNQSIPSIAEHEAIEVHGMPQVSDGNPERGMDLRAAS